METPTIMATTYGNAAAYNVFDSGAGVGVAFPFPDSNEYQQAPLRSLVSPAAVKTRILIANQPKEEEIMSERRLVRVLMVDPHEHVPTDTALLYDSKEVFTDKTNQELFFDIPIGEILKVHNEKRSKIIDKSVKERTQFLEPARIRDLKMVVIDLAKF